MNPVFSLGQVFTTRGVNDLCSLDSRFAIHILQSLERYAVKDWGDTCLEDAAMNDAAVNYGDDRILAVYRHPDEPDWTFWIITEWDHSVTTILFPDEY